MGELFGHEIESAIRLELDDRTSPKAETTYSAMEVCASSTSENDQDSITFSLTTLIPSMIFEKNNRFTHCIKSIYGQAVFMTSLRRERLQISLLRDRTLKLASSKSKANISDSPFFHGKECLGHS